MASKDFTMMRYTIDRSKTLRDGIIDCADQFRKKHGGLVPTIAHISLLATEAPAALGILHVERMKGLFLHEVDLGPVPEPMPEGSGALALILNAERPAVQAAERPVDTNA